jgi:Trehalose utilisation
MKTDSAASRESGRLLAVWSVLPASIERRSMASWLSAFALAGALAVVQSGCGGSFTPGLGSPSPDLGSVVQPPRPDGGVAGDGGAPLCAEGTCKTCTTSAGCSADAPVCDTDANGGLGQCKKVEVIAFYTPDPDMDDRAHAAYTRHANAWFPKSAKSEQFFTYESTTDWDRLTNLTADKGRIVMFLDNVPGDPSQQAGFQSYMENGGAWMGCHVSAYNDDSSNWDWYFNEFLGCGHFQTNTWEPTSANLHVEDLGHPLSQGLGAMFTSAPSEWYSWTNDLRTKSNIEIILSIDPSSFPVGTDPNQSWYSGYYPVAWSNKNYKMLYVNMGHEQMDYGADTALSSTFDSPTQDKLYMNALKWLGGAQQ